MSILEVAAQAFMQKTAGGESLNSSSVVSELGSLLPSSGGDIDLASLVEKFGSSGLTSVVGSWLGDSDNDSIGASEIDSTLGAENISSFANNLGIDSGTASAGLADMLPDLINRNSSGGSILGSLSGLDGVADIAKKLF